MSDSRQHNKNTAMSSATANAVSKYRVQLGEKGRPLSFVRFAWELTKYCRDRNKSVKVSYQTIKNWADGVHIPDFVLILKIFEMSPKESWQHRFAMQIIDLYQEIVVGVREEGLLRKDG